MNRQIQSYIRKVRLQQAGFRLSQDLRRFTMLLIPAVLMAAAVEAVLYLEPVVRERLTAALIGSAAVILIYIVVKWLIHRNGWFGNSADEGIAETIGVRQPEIADKLLNAVQLEQARQVHRAGNDLIDQAVSRVTHLLTHFEAENLKRRISSKQWLSFVSVTAAALLTLVIFHQELPAAFTRLRHPGTEYPVPLPFQLTSLSGNMNILGGDTVSVAFSGSGELPDSVGLHWIVRGEEHSRNLPVDSMEFRHMFTDVFADMIYWSEYKSRRWFSPWDKISTPPDTVFVKDRPVIEDLQFTIIPPEYTGGDTRIHPGNVTDVTVLSGSRIRVDAKSTKHLSMAWALVGSRREHLNVISRKISGSFTLTSDETVTIYCLDKNDVGNLKPAQYRFSVLQDSPPELLISQPERETELDENLLIFFNIQVSDDFGFSEAFLEYRIKHPAYLPPDTSTYRQEIDELVPDARSQQIFYTWDLSWLDIGPEDEVHFRVQVADNNTLTGPGLTSSADYTARFPSLEDMYLALEDAEMDTEEAAEEMMMTLEDVQELVEELELELLKSEDVDWEQSQKSEVILQNMEEVISQIEELQDNLEQINEQLENNNLVDNELQEKFSKLQELLDSIMTPEMLEAMEKLREAMEQMDPDMMMQALEDFEFNMDEMAEELDRFIDMFEQAVAEQKMDEVIRNLEQMLKEQADIAENLRDAAPEEYADLASREKRQELQFENLKEKMDEAADAIDNIAPEQSGELRELGDSQLSQDTGTSISQAQQQMSEQNPQSQESAEQAEANLAEMLEHAQSIRQEFQELTVGQMLAKFQQVLHNTLSISQRQERLRKESKNLRSRSPKIKLTASEQDQIRRQSIKLFEQLSELSKLSFHISPQIGRSLGKARMAMDASIAQLEQNRVSSALREQKTAMEGLNETAEQLLGAMGNMEQTGSASGLESFLQQMEQMSQQQQGINQGTMQLGQMGMMAQQQMMQQLQQQQQALKQALEQMLSEMAGEEPGGLGKAAEDMEEVIKDFKRKRVDRRTQERQERILSRMLDSQKSLTQRDYSKKRRSKSGSEIEYAGPSGLPSGLGEREVLLIKAMSEALDEGYSREYQDVMKTYFRQLQKETEMTETESND